MTLLTSFIREDKLRAVVNTSVQPDHRRALSSDRSTDSGKLQMPQLLICFMAHSMTHWGDTLNINGRFGWPSGSQGRRRDAVKSAKLLRVFVVCNVLKIHKIMAVIFTFECCSF